MMLRTLAPEDWRRQTRAPQWRVGDVVAHLTDSAIRRLSIERDGHAPVAPDGPIGNNAELTAFLDRLNAEWVAASRRISPRLSVELLDIVGRQLAALFEGADLHGTATFPVAWAGDAQSAIWFDIGREYTERWHHHQQIAEAVGAPLLTARRWLYPVLDVSMRALPFAYRDVEAPATTSVTIEITGEAGAQWTLVREPAGWRLVHRRARPRRGAHPRGPGHGVAHVLQAALARGGARIGGQSVAAVTSPGRLLGVLAVMA